MSKRPSAKRLRTGKKPQFKVPWELAFWSRVDVRRYGCWNWRGSRTDFGYGRFWISGKFRKAHQVAYELLVGHMPDGLVPDHLCRNPGCVRPDHLEAVTQRVNILRGVSVVAQNARRDSCINGHQFNEKNTYLYEGRHRHCRACKNESQRKLRRAYAESHRVA